MRVCRFELKQKEHWGQIEGDSIRFLSDAPWSGGVQTQEETALSDVALLVPVTPSKIICVGRNYAAHAKELGNEVPAEPLLFLKPPSVLVASGGEVVLPSQSDRVEYEGEMALVIGRRVRRVDEAEARGGIFGVTAFLDVTARDLQRKDVQFTRGKGFDTFGPCGPWIETDVEWDSLGIQTRINGALRQDGRTSDMIFSPACLVSYISQVMTLEPGDLVVTGTPEGVGPLHAGDVIELELENVGTLCANVVLEQ